ncbi:hypothetical protein F4777DRAFT_583841 [Nemania sp. FL0916]|nr:hypothetical protein F4777DRAFT_583841 [Nemania sp. FL0916]
MSDSIQEAFAQLGVATKKIADDRRERRAQALAIINGTALGDSPQAARTRYPGLYPLYGKPPTHGASFPSPISSNKFSLSRFDTDRAPKVKPKDSSSEGSKATTTRQSEQPIAALVEAAVKAQFEKERDRIIEQIVRKLQPQIEQAAADAAEREIDKMISSASGETPQEKIQAIIQRVGELDTDDLETLFLRSGTMAAALKKVLDRAEFEESVSQWEDIAPGYRAGE